MRFEIRKAWIAERFDLRIVGEVIAEMNNVRNTTKMFQEANRSAERLAGEVIDRHLTVVENSVRYALEMLVNQVLDDRQILSDCRGAHLFMVPHDHHLAR